MLMKSVHQSDPALLQNVLSALPGGVLFCQALRSLDGTLTDLRLTMLNAVAERDLGRRAVDAVGQSFGQLFPDLAKTGLFERYRQVVETGQPARFEYQFTRPGQHMPAWLDVSVVRLDDGLMVLYNDITQIKAGPEAAPLANFFERAFNESVNGMTVFEAVREEDGQISDFRLVTVNAAGLRMNGHRREELLGRMLRQMDPAAGTDGRFEQYVRVCQTGQPFSGEHDHPEHNRWQTMTVVRVPDGILITQTDSPASQGAAAEAARQPAQLLEGILEGVPVGIAVLSAVRSPEGPDFRITNFRVVRTNSVLQKAVCGVVSDVVGRLLTTVFDNASESGLLSRCIMGVELGEPQEFETPHSINGATGWYRVSMAPKEDQLILAVTNITKTRRVQLAHHRQAELLSSVLDGSQNAIIAFDAVRDPAGRIVDFRYMLQNEVNQRRVGRTNEQVLAHTLLEFSPDVASNGLLDHYRRVVETGQPFRQDLAFDFGNGLGWYNMSVVKRADGIVLTVQDKTAERAAEQSLQAHQRQLETTNKELRRLNENLQSFAYVASHDLQEPLRKIQSFGDILLNQHAAQLGTGLNYVERMQAAAGRMSTLIKDLLNYSHIAVRQEVTTPVSLNGIVDATLTDLELVIEETGAVVQVDPLPTVLGEKSQLGQLFQNLLTNALKFRQPGVSPIIRVTARRVAATDLPPSVKPARSSAFYHCIEVADNGIGFEEKYIGRIFQVFQRLHGRSEFAGTGIGLAICEKVAASHGGAITASSQPGQGAIFSVYFPIKEV